MFIHLHTVAQQFIVQFIQTDLGQVSSSYHTDEFLFGFDRAVYLPFSIVDTLFTDFN
jgi:nitric oxide reductase large subunit